VVYVLRNEAGAIVAVYAGPQTGMSLEETNDQDTEVQAFLNPPPPEPMTIVYQVTLWSRMTDGETEQVMAAMAMQPIRIQNIFRSANSYRSDHELWPLLQSVAIGLFGTERASQILESSV
jgi:hypothetical protein